MKVKKNRMFKRILAVILVITTISSNIVIRNVWKVYGSEPSRYRIIYFKDKTKESWVGNDGAIMQLVDNTNGHTYYIMKQVDDNTWSCKVPISTYNVTFNRLSPMTKDGKQVCDMSLVGDGLLSQNNDNYIQWNSWSAGGRDKNNVYAADGAEYGYWYYEDDAKTFITGDVVYLDLRAFDKWKKDSAIIYVKFDNGQTHVLDYEVEENVFAYIITKNDEGAKKLSFYRGNETDEWNASINITISDFENDLNCVKVTGWDKTGNLCKYEGSISYYYDSDGDGLSDYSETIYGTDKNKWDTDEDGLSDADEIIYTGSDPLVYDSLVSEVADGDVDIDEDGLTNVEEIKYSSNPKKSDTDEDGINDYYEVYVYGTNPNKLDSDNDGLVDIEELDLKTNPNNADTDGNTVEDGDEYFIQEVSTNRCVKGLNDDNIAILNELTVSAKGSVNRHINVSEYTGEMLDDTRCFVGKVIEISDSDINGGTIEFKIDESYSINDYVLDDFETNGLLICYNNGEETLPLDTVYDSETRTIKADITSTGIYFIFDIVKFMESTGLTTVNDTNKVSADPTVTQVMLDKAETKEINAQADIVFVIDTTGSMGSAIRNVKNNIIGFVDELKAYGITANYALVDYRDITCDGRNYTNVRKNGFFNFYSNPENFKNAISSLSVSGGGDNLETAIDGLEMARRLDFRKNSQKFVILVTDTGYKIDNNYEIASMEEMINLFVDDEINVSVISGTKYKTAYSGLYEKTGGIFADISGNFSLQLSAIADLIKTRTNDGYWIALNGLIPQIIKLDAKPEVGSIVDTDGDTVSDADELLGVNPTKQFKVNTFLYKLGLPADYSEEYLPVYDYNSNPVKINTDGDGLDDSLDNAPRDEKIHSFLIYETENSDSNLKAVADSLRTAKENLMINGHLQNDYKYADKTENELCDMDWINWSDFFGVSKFSYVISLKEMVTLFSMGDMEDTALEMVNHLIDGTGSDYHDDTLNIEVSNHKNTISYNEGVKECIDELLSENDGNMKALKYDASNRESCLMPDKMIENDKAKYMPIYNDKFGGLGICVDGLYGLRIEVTSYNSGDGSYELHYTLYDIYGLDETDITDKVLGVPFGVLAGFRSWYILQHYDVYAGNVKPFITYMEFDK